MVCKYLQIRYSMPMSKKDTSLNKWHSAFRSLRKAVKDKHDGVVQDAAKACGINYSVFSGIHSGARLPGDKDRKRIEEGLGISISRWPDSRHWGR